MAVLLVLRSICLGDRTRTAPRPASEIRRLAGSDGPMDHRGTPHLQPRARQLPKIAAALLLVDGRRPTPAASTIGAANSQITPTRGDL
jgi:hypothetical protein